MRRRHGLAAAAVAVAVIGVPSAAEARFPTFAPKTIVPGQSIGGVAASATRAAALTRWGRPDTCFTYRGLETCQWKTRVTLNGFPTDVYYATIYLRSGRVVGVQVMRSQKPSFDVKLLQLKTDKNVGIGSSMAVVRARYRIRLTGRGEASESRAQIRTKGRCTMFYAPDRPWTVVRSVSVARCGEAGTSLQ